MLNPDGRDRFVDWAKRNRGEAHMTDSQDREHREPWPGGRTNHYWFDLNRDWLSARQPEFWIGSARLLSSAVLLVDSF